MDAARMYEVWPLHPCTNFATDASWSLLALGEIALVSRSRRRKDVLPDPSAVVRWATSSVGVESALTSSASRY